MAPFVPSFVRHTAMENSYYPSIAFLMPSILNRDINSLIVALIRPSKEVFDVA